MAIRKPTNLSLTFSADLQVDQGSNRVTNLNQLAFSELLPYSSFSNGSLELKNGDSHTFGEFTSGIFLSSASLEYDITGSGNPSTIPTKIFAYNNPTVPVSITVLNTQTSSVTLEYVYGTAL